MGGKKRVGEIQNEKLKFSDLEEFVKTMKYELEIDGIDSVTLMNKVIN